MSDDRHELLEDIISAREAAQILGITQRHVTRLAESGEIAAKRLGREWALSRQSVLAYKAKRESKQSS